MNFVAGEISDRYWNEIKTKANKRGIGFHLDPADAWKVFIFQSKKCAITGKKLEFISSGYRGSASLDRIDSHKPYTRHNVQWVLAEINVMKGRHSMEYFKLLCEMVVRPTADIVVSQQRSIPGTKEMAALNGYGTPGELVYR